MFRDYVRTDKVIVEFKRISLNRDSVDVIPCQVNS